MPRLLIAPYPFKGTLTSREAAETIAHALGDARPELDLRLTPLGDGGSGTLDALVIGLAGRIEDHLCTDVLDRKRRCRLGFLPDGTAVIESAEVIGHARVPAERRNPSALTTRGIGELVKYAASQGAKRIMIGLGDTATHDCGIGLGAALGYRFLDHDGDELSAIGESLIRLDRIDASHVDPGARDLSCIVLCDVMNTLLGEDGAALRFSPQKGADAAMAAMLEEGSRRFAEVVRRDLGRDVADIPGAGAAGGLGAGLAAFLDARLVSGAEHVLRAIDFDDLLTEHDLVITGEGRVDRQTLLGKGVSRVASRAAERGRRCVIVAGEVEEDRREMEHALGATIIELARLADTLPAILEKSA